MPKSSPSSQGYSMPAEWAPHAATWISWPHPGGISFPGCFERVQPALAAMAKAIAESEPLCVNVRDEEHEAFVRKQLVDSPPERVSYHRVPTNEPWCRDHGPVFVTRKQSPKVALIDFGYNAWGWKYPPFEDDDSVPAAIAQLLKMKRFDYGHFILEGGSVDCNGAGVLLTTEACLLNPNRNPEFTRAEIEALLKESLGLKRIIWLGDGIEGDDTDGHVDDMTRFVAETTVVTAIEEDEKDPNHDVLADNLRRLEEVEIVKGEPLEILKLPMPSKIVRKGLRLPASYANFYIANETVLLPVFGETNDAWAESVLRGVFPNRKIVPIDCRELIWGLGAFHCLTQQQPLG